MLRILLQRFAQHDKTPLQRPDRRRHGTLYSEPMILEAVRANHLSEIQEVRERIIRDSAAAAMAWAKADHFFASLPLRT
jgi:hypothetical protein